VFLGLITHSTDRGKTCSLKLAVPDATAAGRLWPAGLTRPAGAVRRIMNDVADGLLLDVRDISIAELRLGDGESALAKALNRLLCSNGECNFNSFSSSI
jgi:hypothetical protein